MNKHICQLLLSLLALNALVSCEDVRGTEPGNDPNPVVLMYLLEVTAPHDIYDDAKVRFVSNNKTEAAYYLAGTTDEIESLKASMGEEGFMNYVVSNGTLLTGVFGESYQEVYIEGLVGYCTIEAVAVGNGQMHRSEIEFYGLEFEDITWGTYNFEVFYSKYAGTFTGYWLGPETSRTLLQKCVTDDTVYRFKDVFGEGYSLYISMLDQYGTKDPSKQGTTSAPVSNRDYGITYQYCRVAPTYVNVYYEYYGGDVYYRDLGYYYGNDLYVTSYGWECRLFENYDAEFCVSYYTNTYRSGIAWGWDTFEADKD